ncbi:MAG: hypothetical protein IGR92_12125 [Leptolyngbyaceae cyanobacterium T60_A2020_046]|nr:hypothetical protein [Leptolyngbyaceae cyanobacterium T60_A2020_046]
MFVYLSAFGLSVLYALPLGCAHALRQKALDSQKPDRQTTWIVNGSYSQAPTGTAFEK